MPGTLYISDLDGTLLRADKTISALTIDTLNGLMDKGLAFTYATARSFTSARPVTAGLNLRLPVITYNGTFLTDPASGQPILRRTLDRAAIEPILKKILCDRIPSLVYGLIDGVERVSHLPADANRQIDEYIAERKGDARMRVARTYAELFAGDLFYITVLTDYETSASLAQLAAQIPSCAQLLQRDIYGARDWWLEIQPASAGKAAAVKALGDMLGFGRLICFGDNLNDLSMFEACDAAYAVENADPAVLRAASGVIGSNECDGVARWLIKNWTGD